MNGQKEITDLVRGGNLPLQEKHTELFKKEGGVFKNDLDVFEKHQGLFATCSASCLFVKCVYVRIGLYTYGDTSLHVRTHEPVHTVA